MRPAGTGAVIRARYVQAGAVDAVKWYEVWWFGGLTDEQSDGLACVVCGQSLLSPRVRSQAWVPVGWSETLSQVFACVGVCARIATAESGARAVRGCMSHG